MEIRPMDRQFVDTGHRVETEVGTELAALKLKKAATAVANGIQDGRDELIAYTRKEPMAALTAAAGLGILVGFALTMGSRSGAERPRPWLPQLGSRRTSFLGRRAGSGWRGLLRLE